MDKKRRSSTLLLTARGEPSPCVSSRLFKPKVAPRLLGSMLASAMFVFAPSVSAQDARHTDAVDRRLSKLDRALSDAARSAQQDRVRVIIQMQAGAGSDYFSRLAALGAEFHQLHPTLNGITATISTADLLALNDDAHTTRVSTDAVVTAQADATMTSGRVLRETLGLKAGGGVISGGSSWAGVNIGVAIVDSGIEPSKDLGISRITRFFDFTRGGKAVTPYDDYGHGTHVAGLIAGSGDWSGDEYEGPASKARLIGYKVLNGSGWGYTSDVIAALEHAIANRTRYGIHVMNLSLGHPIYEPAATDPLVRVVERAVGAGIVVVTSAGNYGTSESTGLEGYAGVTSPGNAPSAITVGAIDVKNTVTRLDDAVTPYSSRGPTWYEAYAKPDLTAPGQRLVAAAALKSSLYANYPELRVTYKAADGARYFRLSGTSMAAALTSGVIAVMLEANLASAKTPLAPNAIKAVLEFTSFWMPNIDAFTQGAGALNAAGAIRLAEVIATDMAVGSLWLERGITPYDTIGFDTLGWVQHGFWGDYLLPDGTMYVHERAWDRGIIWGDRFVFWNRIDWTDSAASLVWGDRLIWGNRFIWGNRLIWGNSLLGYDDGSQILYGDQINWTTVDSLRFIWGNLADATTSSTEQSVATITLKY